MSEEQWNNYAVNLFNNVLRDPPGSCLYMKYLDALVKRFPDDYSYRQLSRLASAAIENRATNGKRGSPRA